MEDELIEKEIKGTVISYFKEYHSDQFDYVTEKCTYIESLAFEDLYKCFIILHPIIKLHLYNKLSNSSKQYLIEKLIFTQRGELH